MLIDTGLSEHTAQFAFAGACWLPWASAGTALGFRLHREYLCAIHLHIQVWDRAVCDYWETKLLGRLDILLLPGLDVGSNGFGGPLDRFRGDLQVGQEFELVACWNKGSLAADGSQHASHAGREIRLVDVERDVGGKLSVVTRRAPIVRALDTCPAHCGEDRTGTHALVIGRVAANARDGSMLTVRLIEAQQLGDRSRARLMYGGADGHFHGFQIQAAGSVPVGEDALKLML
ncbi:MAG: hypothetical protein HY820_16960 [Acidobacteria bacterium]|nr:hypothetical protein [Acidobacteriota bacterium]